MKNPPTSTFESLQNEINLLNQKIEDVKEIVHRNHWELQNCIRFYVADKQIGFKMWQMNIPTIGEIVEIQYRLDNEIYDFVSHLFGYKKTK